MKRELKDHDIKSLLVSIRPEHVINILNGDKTLELRKSVPKDFKGWVYIYCSKGQSLYWSYEFSKYFVDDKPAYNIKGTSSNVKLLSGKVVARFYFDEFTFLKYGRWVNHKAYDWNYRGCDDEHLDTFQKLCLTEKQVTDYGDHEKLYAWHIKNFKVLEPMQLSDFYSQIQIKKDWLEYKNRCGDFTPLSEQQYFKHYYRNPDKVSITKAPQRYQFVYVKEKENE